MTVPVETQTDSGSENIGVSASRKSWHGWRRSAEAIIPLDMRTTLEADAEQAGRAIEVPKREERWLEEVSSKAVFSSGALEENCG